MLDLRFDVDDLADQPVDAEFSATFKNPEGVSLDVPGFYNGGNEYVVRFTPPTAGVWDYITHSSQRVLDGQRGELSVKPARDGRRGGVVLGLKNRCNFEYENGETYFSIAF